MRADRLLSLLLVLHAKGRMTAAELAAHLEVSERTIYRDIEALCAAGVPLYTQSGPSGGLFLDEHYRVSLTGLSRTEVMSLFVSGDVGPLADLGLARAQAGSLLKLLAALPSIHRLEVDRMRQRIYIDSANWFQHIETPSVFPVLQQAVWEDRLIRTIYQPVEGERGERTIEAYALVAKVNIWYLVGKKPGGDMRNYRISRFEETTLLDEHFARDSCFDLPVYWKTTCQAFETEQMVRFPPYRAMLRVAPEAFWFFPGYMEGKYEKTGAPDANGWLTLRVAFDSPAEAQMRVLGLGTGVEILEPDALRLAVLETAKAVVAFHTASGGHNREKEAVPLVAQPGANP